MKNLLIAVLSLGLLSAPAYAHDMKFHKGPMFEGEITAVRTDGLDLKTEKGQLQVSFTSDTKFEVGNEGKSGNKSDLSVGEHLMVSGHKLESGELAATEIMIHGVQTSDSKEHDHKE